MKKYKRYSDKEMLGVVKKLDLEADKDGYITAHGVAKIWTWRLKEESEIEHKYTDTSVRKRVHDKSLSPVSDVKGKRLKFHLEDAFLVPLYPKKIVTKGIDKVTK